MSGAPDLTPGQSGVPAADPLLEQAINEQVDLAPYNEEWPAQFALERARLLDLFPQLLAVEHIGSTAIPGMPAKPIVDLLAGVESMAIADALFDPILAAGYTTSRAFNAMLPDRRWFMRAANGRRTHHLHVVVMNSATWQERLRFRDVLRSDPEVARQYGKLKAGLAATHRHDREAYTDGKSAFVASILLKPNVDPPAVLRFRPLTADDQDKLWHWLHVALWDPPPAGLRPIEVLHSPPVRIYAEDWGRSTDVGIVAQIDGIDAGACWMRLLPVGTGLGSVDDVTPQLGIALEPQYQHKGFGRPLMLAALAAARTAGYEHVSLTVHPENRARNMYASCGFRTISSAITTI